MWQPQRDSKGLWADWENKSDCLDEDNQTGIWKINTTWSGKEWLEWCFRWREQHDQRPSGAALGTGHIVGTEGMPGWVGCVCSTGASVPVLIALPGPLYAPVRLFPPTAGFAASSLDTEVFSMCWSVTTTRGTTSISGSGALMPRPSRCRVSAGSSSERESQGWGAHGCPSGAEELRSCCVPSPLPPPVTHVNTEPMRASPCTVNMKNWK